MFVNRASHQLPATSLRANVAETLLASLITEQGGKELQHQEHEDIFSGLGRRAQWGREARPKRAAVGAEHPNPEVVARAKRRIFTGEYKQLVLAEADMAKEDSGGIRALLRREGQYSSHLSTWRHERAAGILHALTPQKRGLKSKSSPLDDENQKVRRENQHLSEELRKAEIVIDIQKKWPLYWGARSAPRTGNRNSSSGLRAGDDGKTQVEFQ